MMMQRFVSMKSTLKNITKRGEKKKRSKKRKHYNSPLVITESNSSHLWDLYSFEDAIDNRSPSPHVQHQVLYEQEPEIETTEVVVTKKKKMIKKKRSKDKSLCPKTKTVFKKTTLRRSSTHKKNDPEYR